MKTAWAYARFSSDHQREESIDAQLRAIQDYCQRSGYVLTNIYRDEAKSATTDDRPQFQQMFKDVNSTPPDVVIVHKLDRFSRDRYDSAFYKRKLKERGVQLVSVLENIDGSPESIILESVLEGMAEYYSRNLAREVQKGKRETAHQGKHTGGRPPLGYDVNEDGTYSINPVEAQWVRSAFEMKANGKSYNDIAAYLNGIGARSKVGKRFTKNSFHDLFKNEKYKGVYIYDRAAAKVAGKRNNHAQKPAEEMIRIEGGMPQIIDTETWDYVNHMMGDRTMNARHKAKRVYLLSGIIFCGECGSPMSGNTRRAGRNKKEYSSYECNRRRREKTCTNKDVGKAFLEDLVVRYLEDEFFTDENITSLAKKIVAFQNSRKNETGSELSALKAELASHEKEIQNIVRAVEKGMFKDWMVSAGDEHDERIQYLKGRIEYIENMQSAKTLTEQQVYDFIAKDSSLKEKTPEQLKSIIQTYVEKVLVFKDRIEIHLIIDTNNPGNKMSRDCGYDGGDGENRTRVRKHFHKSFSERSFCFRVSLLKTPKSRLFRRLSCYSPMLPGIHIEFSCIVVAGHPAYR